MKINNSRPHKFGARRKSARIITRRPYDMCATTRSGIYDEHMSGRKGNPTRQATSLSLKKRGAPSTAPSAAAAQINGRAALIRDVTTQSRKPRMPPKRAEIVAQRIVKDIQDKGLRSGDALPTEADMYQAQGVGRSTLREALRLLELQGVVEIRPGRGGGPIVAAPDSRHLASTLALLMQFSQTPFRSVLETRTYVEPLAATLCAKRGDPQIAKELRASVKRMLAGFGDEDVFLAENQLFHELIARGSQNPLISYFVNSLDWVIDGARLGVTYSRPARKYVAEIHDEICKAIEAGDPDTAGQAMGLHMAETMEYLEHKFPKVMDKVVTWEMYGN